MKVSEQHENSLISSSNVIDLSALTPLFFKEGPGEILQKANTLSYLSEERSLLDRGGAFEDECF
jgi:hypothetical protein